MDAADALESGAPAFGRLYLDLGDLLDIGDGRAESRLVARLRDAMTEAGATLVVSTDHVQDVWRGRPDCVESLVRAVEYFQPVLAVMEGPDAVEPLTHERTDIVVAPCTNFRHLVYSDAARKVLPTRIGAYDQIHAGECAAQQVVSSAPLPQIRSRRANELFMQGFVTLARGWMGGDVEAIVRFWEGQLALRVGVGEREGILVWLRAAAEILPALHALADEHGIDVTEALRRWAACEGDPEAFPGQYIALRVAAARRRNVTRKPRPSDWLDIDHAKHLPYVDFATCDANTFATVGPLLRTMTCPRQPIVIQNGRLADVAVAICAVGRHVARSTK